MPNQLCIIRFAGFFPCAHTAASCYRARTVCAGPLSQYRSFLLHLPLTDYMRKTQICVRAALAIQHVLHDIASGSVLRIDSRKRVIVTNRFFAKVK